MEPEKHHLELIPLQPGQHHVTLLPRTATDLPFFYLTKQKQLLQKPIRFEGTDLAGRPMRWTVTPNNNPAIGAPAIEAHEIWVRLVVPSITGHRTPDGRIPSIIPLGGLRQSLRTVGWSEGGFTARRLLKALRQIGSAWCVADFWMPTSELDESGQPKFAHVKGEFSRMALYAIGSKHLTDEQLRDGNFDFDFDLEDTVYVQLHPLEVSLQQNQPPRLVDNQYLFSVGPAARRWYELVAPKIYGVLKHKKKYCDIQYSWYLRHHHTLKRCFQRYRVTNQMNRLVKDHLRAGYVQRVEYRAVKEPGKEIDYLIRYYPGPAATASIERVRHHNAKRRRATTETPVYSDQRSTEIDDRFIEEPPVRKPVEQGSEHPLLSELTRRGIHISQARKLLASLAEGQEVADQLEWGDSLIQSALPGEFHNPPGFYAYLIRQNVPTPDDFQTTRKRKLREEMHRAEEATGQEAARLRLDYENYCEHETDRYIAEQYQPEEYQALLAAKEEEFLARDPNNRNFRPDILKLITIGAVRAAIKQRIPFTTFETFCQEQKPLTPIPPSAEPPPEEGTPPTFPV